MKRVLIALGLSGIVFPGLGQLYNKEKKKGFIIILFLSVVILVFVYHLTSVMANYLPAGMTDLEVGKAREIIGDIAQKYPKPFFYYNLLFLAIWSYSIIDAGIVSLNKQKHNEKQNAVQDNSDR
ncbi:MAG: hypothetical protein ABII27_01485 [bacterium]